MKIIELTELQFRNYSLLHSKRNYYQTVEYADLKLTSDCERLYLGLLDNSNNVTAATLILGYKINSKLKYGYAPKGYLIDFNNKELLDSFSKELIKYLKNLSYIYVRIDPLYPQAIYNKQGTIVEKNDKIFNNLKMLGYNHLGYYSNFTKFGIVLNTSDNVDYIYKNLNRSTKRNIKFALDRGITIHQGTDKDLNLFYDLVKNNTTKGIEYFQRFMDCFDNDNNKFEIYFTKLNPEIYIKNFQFLLKREQERNSRYSNMLQNNGRINTNKVVNKKMHSDKLLEKYKNEIIKATNIYKLFPNGIIISTCGIVRNNREIYFIIDGHDKKLNYIHSSSLIKWEIIKKYLQEGYEIFNFGNISNNYTDKKDPYLGWYLSKIGFGGKIIEYPGEFDLVINKYLYTIYSSFANMKLKKS